mmetsp:Transcript_152950/g.490672  ORF Transcript_152950/g.490672 Transcript_152950/m.490672 type:complete len:567 (+) Transcript_152950:44-1744(+)
MALSYAAVAAAAAPARARAPCGKMAVDFFHEADPADLSARYVWQEGWPPALGGAANGGSLPARGTGLGPRLLQSHGWLEGSLLDYDSLEAAAAVFDAAKPDTWPRVLPRQDVLFVDGFGKQRPAPVPSLRVPLDRLRPSTASNGSRGGEPPRLSVLLVRWGGRCRIGEGREHEAEGEGGWGKYGAPPSDLYMSSLVKEGFKAHPELGGSSGSVGRNFEMFSLFVGSSTDMSAVIPVASNIAATLRGEKKASFWMLWPAEWEDFDETDYAGYVQTQAIFPTMRACEAVGIRSTFPHPADQYELITSKSWMVTLAPRPEAALPAAVFAEAGAVLADPLAAARRALAELAAVRAANPFPRGGDGSRPAPSNVNGDGTLRKGMVKAGWTWEGRFVLSFTGEKELAKRLEEMLLVDGYLGSRCLVQEWVDFDFEIRLFFLPPGDWAPGTPVRPVRFEYNGWGKPQEEGRPGAFRKLSREKVLKEMWHDDTAALDAAQERAVEISQDLLSWLHESHPAQPVAMVRLDFMLLRLGPGQARVVFGEFCELGACCISWEQGPPTIWRAAIDYALR